MEDKENTGTPPVNEQNNGGKTFTQEEVNNIVETRLAKARKDMPSQEELKQYNDWKQSQKTEQEKINEQIMSLKTSNTTLTNENAQLKAQIEVIGSNTKKEFVKFVTSEVLSMTNDTTDFKTALKEYKKDNPQYFGETVVRKTQTSPNLNNGGNTPQTTNDIMNNILRGNN